MTYLREEKELLLEGIGVPEVATAIEGRHVPDRGPRLRLPLRPATSLRPYISEYKPLLMGVDGGADALIEAGYKPDMIIGDMDSCSDASPAVRCRTGRPRLSATGARPACERARGLGLQRCGLPGTRHQRGRGDAAGRLQGSRSCWSRWAPTPRWSSSWTRAGPGMASTFLTRLRVGPKLVDAKGVSRIYRSQIKTWHLVLLVLVGHGRAGHRPALHRRRQRRSAACCWRRIRDLIYWVKELFT